MDGVIEQLMSEFCAERDLARLPESERFEIFALHCVLNEHAVAPFDAAEFRIGGGADGGFDGYAVVLGEQLYRDPKELGAAISAASDVTPTIVIVQAKTSTSMSRSVIADLRVQVEQILHTEDVVGNSSDALPLRECLWVMKRNLPRLSARGVRVVIAYVTTAPRANAELLRNAEQASRALADIGIVKDVSFQCVGREALARLYDRAQWSKTSPLEFSSFYSMPTDSGVTRGRQGLVPARALVRALSDDGDVLIPALFSENLREYRKGAEVNEEIRATLRDDRKRQLFATLNNGVTIVSRTLRVWPDATVMMRDFQVVNGAQTCHVLAEERQLLDDVWVKVQVLECDDDDIINEIVMATNRQTAIPRTYLVNRRSLFRRLEVHYRRQRALGRPLLFGRRPAKGGNDLRSGVISLSRQLLAHVAMFGPLPPSRGHRDLDGQIDKLFANAAVESFYTAAAALYRWNWLVASKRIAAKYGPLGYQAIAALGVLHGLRPLDVSERKQVGRLSPVDEVIWHDGRWERLAIDIQSILDDALDGLSSPDPRAAATSVGFGRSVVALAARRPRR
ncbi:MAG TPA: AIPR family protein [Stackebrandtia sp.]|jgi:hypothetical protein|uniref:AIPR family protein n=1 Tax=Stackebrandtia sp. TaxID=2023065 RepID=UPI002D6FB1D5|nr:AIPR family protein [Stackebrandtia sp.]HZE37397.1 AIPR family protein [Stackebrandtia sp.]